MTLTIKTDSAEVVVDLDLASTLTISGLPPVSVADLQAWIVQRETEVPVAGPKWGLLCGHWVKLENIHG